MRTIWKYPIEITDRFVHDIPSGALFLTLASDPQLAMWFEVDTDRPTEMRQFAVFGTGHLMQEDVSLTYRGTVFVQSSLVFHVFEEAVK